MIEIGQWYRKHQFTVHLVAFCLMVVPSILLYLAAGAGSSLWIWVLLGIVILANLVLLAGNG